MNNSAFTNWIIGLKKVFLLLMGLLLINTVSANETDIRPFIKGSFNQIKQKHKDKPCIVTFWSESCAFCMKELALFGKLLQAYPDVAVVSITTDPFLDEKTIKQILSSKNLGNVQKWMFADDYVERLYFDVDRSWLGGLPLTYFFDRNNKMIKHLGVIKEQELTEWLALQNAGPIK